MCGQSLVFSKGRVTLHFASRLRRSLHLVNLHGGLKELRSGLEKGVRRRKELSGLRSRRDVRGICSCKDDRSPKVTGLEKGIRMLDWPILNRWDVPWDWKTTLLIMMASALRLRARIFLYPFEFIQGGISRNKRRLLEQFLVDRISSKSSSILP